MDILAQAVSRLIPGLPPDGQPVPQALADAVGRPRSSAPAQVPLRARDRVVDVWVAGGTDADAGVIWARVLELVAAEPDDMDRLVRAEMPAGMTALVDGHRFTVSRTASDGERRALKGARGLLGGLPGHQFGVGGLNGTIGGL